MGKTKERAIFESGSKTYSTASRLFPRHVQGDVEKLYSFVRVADDYVDSTPQRPELFFDLKNQWQQMQKLRLHELTVLDGDSLNCRVAKNMATVTQQYQFEMSWVEAFLAAMESDLHHTGYQTLDESLGYVYGSAEVIGLMMARLLGLPNAALPGAQLQGRAMQWINFIRDINEDNALGRCYFPQQELAQYGLTDLLPKTAAVQPDAFLQFMQAQLQRYNNWQNEATKSHRFIPYRTRIAVATAVHGYDWTARQIAKNPFIIYQRKVKPPKALLIGYGLKGALTR